MSTSLTVPDKQQKLAKDLNEYVGSVINQDALQGFERAFHVATAIGRLKEMLTPEYMKPIMSLAGNKLGFKTDKDDRTKFPEGYSEEVVKNCLIEAVLTGFQPTNNEFNIISGQMYGTKEGFGAVLGKMKGLKYDIDFDLPRINSAKDGAVVKAKITWTLKGVTEVKEVEFPIKMNAYSSVDSIIGKATRKARAWLFNKINGTDVGEADVQDADFKVMPQMGALKEADVTLEELIMAYEEKKPDMTAVECKNADRIIQNKEVNSYRKLMDLLIK